MALAAYRHLLRATKIAFQGILASSPWASFANTSFLGDAHLLHAARGQARNGFNKQRSLDASSKEAADGITHAEGVAEVLKHNVVQGQQVEGSDKLSAQRHMGWKQWAAANTEIRTTNTRAYGARRQRYCQKSIGHWRRGESRWWQWLMLILSRRLLYMIPICLLCMNSPRLTLACFRPLQNRHSSTTPFLGQHSTRMEIASSASVSRDSLAQRGECLFRQCQKRCWQASGTDLG